MGNKTEEDSLRDFTNLIIQNKDLSDFRIFLGDHFLEQFLAASKYESAKAYQTFVGYVGIRRVTYNPFFKSIRPSRSLRIFETGMVKVLKHRDHFDQIVFLCRTRLWDPTEIDTDEILKMVVMLGDELLVDENIKGIVIIFDLAEYSTKHLKAVTPQFINKMINLFWKNIPVKYKGVHIVNEIWLFRAMFNAVKPFFPKKLKDRLHLHSEDYSSLHKQLSPDILPESLGGKLADDLVLDSDFEQRILNKESYYNSFAELL